MSKTIEPKRQIFGTCWFNSVLNGLMYSEPFGSILRLKKKKLEHELAGTDIFWRTALKYPHLARSISTPKYDLLSALKIVESDACPFVHVSDIRSFGLYNFENYVMLYAAIHMLNKLGLTVGNIDNKSPYDDVLYKTYNEPPSDLEKELQVKGETYNLSFSIILVSWINSDNTHALVYVHKSDKDLGFLIDSFINEPFDCDEVNCGTLIPEYYKEVFNWDVKDTKILFSIYANSNLTKKQPDFEKYTSISIGKNVLKNPHSKYHVVVLADFHENVNTDIVKMLYPYVPHENITVFTMHQETHHATMVTRLMNFGRSHTICTTNKNIISQCTRSIHKQIDKGDHVILVGMGDFSSDITMCLVNNFTKKEQNHLSVGTFRTRPPTKHIKIGPNVKQYILCNASDANKCDEVKEFEIIEYYENKMGLQSIQNMQDFHATLGDNTLHKGDMASKSFVNNFVAKLSKIFTAKSKQQSDVPLKTLDENELKFQVSALLEATLIFIIAQVQ